MPRHIDSFTRERRLQPGVLDADCKVCEQHVSYRHLVNNRVEPIDKQKLEIRRFARHLHGDEFLHLGVRNDGGQGDCRLLERFGACCSEATYANVSIVRKMRPSCAAHDRILGTVALSTSFCRVRDVSTLPQPTDGNIAGQVNSAP